MKIVYTTLIILSIIGSSYLSQIAFAGGDCIQVFGGGNICQKTSNNFSLTKQVKNPQTNQFVSSLSANGPYFEPNQDITFRITIENKTTTKYSNVVITDTFPTYFTFVSGDGKFDQKKHTLTTTITTLNSKEKKSYEVSGKVASAGDLSNLSGQTNCFINQISSTIRGSTAEANTQYCVQKTPVGSTGNQSTDTTTKGGQPIPTQTPSGKIVYAPQPTTQVPPTGAESWSWVALIPVIATGFVIRKKSALS